LLLLLLLPVAACGSASEPIPIDDPLPSDASPAASSPAGEYVSNGVPGWPDGAEPIRLTLEQRAVHVTVGCNRMSGPASWTVDGPFEAGPFAGTQMACEDAVMEREAWAIRFLERADRLVVDGTDLALRAGGQEVWFVPASEVEGEEPAAVELEGTTWRLRGLTETDGDSSGMLAVPGDVEAVLTIEDGALHFTTGCNDGHGTVRVGDGTLELGGVGVTRRACPGAAAEVERGVLRVLTADRLACSVSGKTLTLELPSGRYGLQYAAG